MSLEAEPFVPVSSEPVFTVLGMEAVPGRSRRRCASSCT